MRLTIHLLGQPRIVQSSGEPYVIRSRKSWALLAYLLLTERPPTRTQLASLLFSETDDPLRALRWNLSELRRALGAGTSIEGDPVVLELPPDAAVDALVMTRSASDDALRLPGFGAELLEAFHVRDGEAFDHWLLAEQRHIAAATEAILHEAALASLSRGQLEAAIDHAVQLVTLSPLDENNQALLIRLYRLAGDPDAAQQQADACLALLRSELGVEPGEVVTAALLELPRDAAVVADTAAIVAILEAGRAAIAAGATRAGVDSLRTAVRMADGEQDAHLRMSSRLVLAEALIHSRGGLDEEGLASLHEAHEIATAVGDRETAAQARAELGYVDFLRGSYDRAEHRLSQDIGSTDGSPAQSAKVAVYLGSIASDRGRYPEALEFLAQAEHLSREADDVRGEAFATSMIGRVHLLRGELDAAADQLNRSITLAEADHWLAFLAWPQALLGEVQLLAHELLDATKSFEQAFARACHIEDPCWEGLSARGLALMAASRGDVSGAFTGLLDARERCRRLADPYVWLDAYILDVLCDLGVQHGHAMTASWIAAMNELTARTGMTELRVRALRHAAASGAAGAAEAAGLLAANIDNPRLNPLDVAASQG